MPHPVRPRRREAPRSDRADGGMTRLRDTLVRLGPPVVAWGAVVAYALLSVGAPLLGHGVFLGTDVVVRYDPWLGGALPGPPPVNTWIGDTIDFYAPQTMLLADTARSGDYAWWNPYIIGGTSLGALPDTGLFSPMTWAWLLVPATYAPGLMKLVEIAVGVLGTALFTRRLGLSSAAQAVAGLVYVSGGFMVAWTNWPHTRVAALVPLLFWAADRVLVRRRVRDAAPLALVVAAILLTGFPAVFGYAIYGVLAFAVVRLVALRAVRRDWLRAAGVGVGGAVVGALLSAWQLVPWLLHAGSTIDFDERQQAPWRHLDWTALASAVAPRLIGDVGDTSASFWIASANPVEAFSYLGVAALVLVCLAVLLPGRTRTDRLVGWFALGGAAVCVVLIYQGGWPLWLAQQLPIFSNNSVTRLRFLLTFFLALAAGVGLDRLLRRARGATVAAPADPATPADPADPAADPADPADAGVTADEPPAPARRRVPPAVATALRWAAVAVVLGGTAALVVAALGLVPDAVADDLRGGVLVVAATAAGLGLLVLLAALTRRRVVVAVAAAAVPVVLLAQALGVSRTWWPVSDEDTFYPTTATHEYLADHLGADRFLGVGWTMLTGTNTVYELRSVTGHGFHTPQWRALLRAADPDAMLTRTYSQLPIEAVDSPVLDRMAVAYAVDSPTARPAGLRQVVGTYAGDYELDGVATAPFLGPLRGVEVSLPSGVPAGASGTLRVRVETLDGALVTETSQTLPGPGASRTWVALAAEDVPRDQAVRLVLDVEGARRVVVPSDVEGRWVTRVVRVPDDGLTVVRAGEATVYAREDAAPRVRWASDELVVADEAERLATLASGDVPTSTVVLEDGADALGGLDGTSTADVELLEDGGTVRVRVDADDDGWLVLSESVRSGGWTATVDGRPTPLVDADEAMGAVAVPAGEHEVRIAFRPGGLTAGVAGSVVGVLAVVALVVVPLVADRRRSARS